MMILCNRNIDFATILLHPWHYGALIHDILGIRNNKVSMKNEITENKEIHYDLDPINDLIWSKKMNIPYSIVAEESE